MTTADRIQRAHVKGTLPGRPSDYEALARRILMEDMPTLTEREQIMAHDLCNADIFEPFDLPGKPRRYLMRYTKKIEIDLESPYCPHCQANADEVARLVQRVIDLESKNAELEELLQEKQAARLAS